MLKKSKTVQEVLKVQDASMLTEIEEVLKERKRVAHEKSLDPMAVGELTSRVEESIADYKAGRVKGSKELLKKYGQRDMKILWSEPVFLSGTPKLKKVEKTDQIPLFLVGNDDLCNRFI